MIYLIVCGMQQASGVGLKKWAVLQPGIHGRREAGITVNGKKKSGDCAIILRAQNKTEKNRMNIQNASFGKKWYGNKKCMFG